VVDHRRRSRPRRKARWCRGAVKTARADARAETNDDIKCADISIISTAKPKSMLFSCWKLAAASSRLLEKIASCVRVKRAGAPPARRSSHPRPEPSYRRGRQVERTCRGSSFAQSRPPSARRQPDTRPKARPAPPCLHHRGREPVRQR
jgi:hypothetical protein